MINGKPEPEIYNKAIANLQLKPIECLIIEDNDNGIKAAKASGAHVMEVKTVYDVNYDDIKSFIKNIEENAL